MCMRIHTDMDGVCIPHFCGLCVQSYLSRLGAKFDPSIQESVCEHVSTQEEESESVNMSEHRRKSLSL